MSRASHHSTLQRLGRTLKGAWSRRVLHACGEHRPAVLTLCLSCLELTTEDTNAPQRALAGQALRAMIAEDCGLYLLCREWCELESANEAAATNELRQQLLQAAFERLPAACQRIGTSKPSAGVRNTHPCFSIVGGPRPARYLVEAATAQTRGGGRVPKEVTRGTARSVSRAHPFPKEVTHADADPQTDHKPGLLARLGRRARPAGPASRGAAGTHAPPAR